MYNFDSLHDETPPLKRLKHEKILKWIYTAIALQTLDKKSAIHVIDKINWGMKQFVQKTF